MLAEQDLSAKNLLTISQKILQHYWQEQSVQHCDVENDVMSCSECLQVVFVQMTEQQVCMGGAMY